MRITRLLAVFVVLVGGAAFAGSGPVPNLSLHYTLTPPGHFKPMPPAELDAINGVPSPAATQGGATQGAATQSAAAAATPDPSAPRIVQGFRTTRGGQIPFILIQQAPRSRDSKKDLLQNFQDLGAAEITWDDARHMAHATLSIGNPKSPLTCRSYSFVGARQVITLLCYSMPDQASILTTTFDTLAASFHFTPGHTFEDAPAGLTLESIILFAALTAAAVLIFLGVLLAARKMARARPKTPVT